MEMTLAKFFGDDEEQLNEYEIAWRSKDWDAVDKLVEQFKEPAENMLFDTMNKLTAEKVHVNVTNRDYNKFWIDNALSQHVDCIDSVYVMNLVGSKLSDQDHFNYYFHAIRQQKRFGKWAKLVEDPEEKLILSLISKHWSINQYDAMMYRDMIISKGQMNSVLKTLKPLATKEHIASVIKTKADQTKMVKAVTKW